MLKTGGIRSRNCRKERSLASLLSPRISYFSRRDDPSQVPNHNYPDTTRTPCPTRIVIMTTPDTPNFGYTSPKSSIYQRPSWISSKDETGREIPPRAI